jgi:hypothetical protein
MTDRDRDDPDCEDPDRDDPDCEDPDRDDPDCEDPDREDAREPERGRGDPVTAAATVEADGVEYRPDEGVSFVAARVEGEERRRTVAFGRWAHDRAAQGARERAEAAVHDRLGLAGEAADAVRATVDTPDPETRRVVVVRRLTLDREGRVVRAPTVEYARVRDATPRRVDVSVTLDARTHRESLPIHVADRTTRLH